MTKVSKMEFEFEYPDEFSDETVEEMTLDSVMESLQDSHVHPEISKKEEDWFIVKVMELAEKAKQDMIACAYNARRAGAIDEESYKEKDYLLPKLFMAAYGRGMERAWTRNNISKKEKDEISNLTHFF